MFGEAGVHSKRAGQSNLCKIRCRREAFQKGERANHLISEHAGILCCRPNSDLGRAPDRSTTTVVHSKLHSTGGEREQKACLEFQCEFEASWLHLKLGADGKHQSLHSRRKLEAEGLPRCGKDSKAQKIDRSNRQAHFPFEH